MITKLYSFYETPFSHDVCHIFEHIVLRSFLYELKKNNYNRTFFGWLRGQTIDSTLFFDFGAYSEEVAQLFDNHLSTLGDFDTDLISQSIAHVEAEMECEIEIIDKPLLMTQFEQLSDIVKNKSTKSVSSKDPLKVKYLPGNFQEIAIVVNVFTQSESTKKAFLVLYPAVIDFIRDVALDQEAVYPTGKSALAINDDGIGIAWRFNAKKSVNIEELESATLECLQNFKATSNVKNMKNYQAYFSSNPLTNTALIEFYEQTNLKATLEELSELIAVQPLKEIMDNMTVRISLISGKLKNLEWDY